jgi:hypothetical protein
MDAYKLFASSLGVRPGRESYVRIAGVERHDERARSRCDVKQSSFAVVPGFHIAFKSLVRGTNRY